ncbi:MAG: hypothetical protein NT056_05670 [Proteobacteria bacterium]|nr:hypothetical protein [Pseudomonadota bacterium]
MIINPPPSLFEKGGKLFSPLCEKRGGGRFSRNHKIVRNLKRAGLILFLILTPLATFASDLPKELTVKELSGAANGNGIVESGGGCGCRQFGSSSPDPVALRRIILSAVFLFFVIILIWKGGKRGKKKNRK